MSTADTKTVVPEDDTVEQICRDVAVLSTSASQHVSCAHKELIDILDVRLLRIKARLRDIPPELVECESTLIRLRNRFDAQDLAGEAGDIMRDYRDGVSDKNEAKIEIDFWFRRKNRLCPVDRPEDVALSERTSELLRLLQKLAIEEDAVAK
jgi:hypothetical protein